MVIVFFIFWFKHSIGIVVKFIRWDHTQGQYLFMVMFWFKPNTYTATFLPLGMDN